MRQHHLGNDEAAWYVSTTSPCRSQLHKTLAEAQQKVLYLNSERETVFQLQGVWLLYVHHITSPVLCMHAVLICCVAYIAFVFNDMLAQLSEVHSVHYVLQPLIVEGGGSILLAGS